MILAYIQSMQKTKEFVTGTQVYDISGIVRGEQVQRPHLSKYTVFVQSQGSGARHLSAESLLLYEVIQIILALPSIRLREE